MKKALLNALFLFGALPFGLQAQNCTPLATAVQTPLTLVCSGGTLNRSGVAWNPTEDLYYSCNAGSASYPFETFSSLGGLPVSTNTGGISWRGLWWNPTLNQLEGTGNATLGWNQKDLDASGYALATNTLIFTGQNQPNVQSCGDFDYDANEVLFYDAGSIYRYDRATSSALGNYPLVGLPAGTISDYSVVYTGCPGQEIGVYDYTNSRLLLCNKANGNFVTSVQMPATAPAITTFRISYANNLLWLFNSIDNTWYSYEIFTSCSPIASTDVVVACDSYAWIDGNTYTSNNTTATYTLPAANGCDSVVTLNLSMNYSTTGTDVQTACGSYQWIDGNTYTSSNNTATFVLSNSNGCDSTVTLNLTLNPLPDVNVTQSGALLTSDQTGALYQWLDCANFTPIVGETTQSFLPANTGNYAVEVSLNGCMDTSACYLVDYSGIDELVQSEKTLVRIVDLLGRETQFVANTPLIFIYSDGTTERVMKLED